MSSDSRAIKSLASFSTSPCLSERKAALRPLKIIVNATGRFKGGSLQVIRSFLSEARNLTEHELHVVLGPTLANTFSVTSYPGNFFWYSVSKVPDGLPGRMAHLAKTLSAIEERCQADVVFATSGPAYWRSSAPYVAGYNLPHYIYPDSPFFDLETTAKRIEWRIRGMLKLGFFRRETDAYVTQTADVAQRVKKYLGCERVYVVPNTCAAHYLEPPRVKKLLPNRKPGEYRLLTLSAWYRHKNLRVIPEVVSALPAELRQRTRFVLTLGESDYRENFPDWCHPNVVNVGPVPVEDGPSLYAECDAMFLPTLLECFSASYPEAMATRRPILTSDLSFARSICGDAAEYFDPLDPGAIARSIERVMNSEEHRARLISAGALRLQSFGTARQRAERFLAICEEMAGKDSTT